LEECKSRGISVHQYEFANIRVEGVTRYDASHWLLDTTRRKAFDILRVEFGASARFGVGPEPLDFFWRKAHLAVKISGPLIRQRFYSDGKLKRAQKGIDMQFAKSMGWLPGIRENAVHLMNIPYYQIWHTPTRVINEIRSQLIASGAYPRLRVE
jgi:hypothetical protein